MALKKSSLPSFVHPLSCFVPKIFPYRRADRSAIRGVLWRQKLKPKVSARGPSFRPSPTHTFRIQKCC